jgi:hypothetical protein
MLCGALFALPARAGDKALPGPGFGLWQASAGLESRGDHLHGGGADYKARFDAHGFAFTPALGRAVPQERPLGFALLSATREHGPALPLDLAVAPRQMDNTAVFARGSGLSERYDVLPQGVEQSFVFATPLAGSGDLVVRGLCRTELALAHADASGVRCADEFGGVSIGAVTGIDAAGHSVQGSLELQDGVLELRLPGAFVDAASWPLTLDPLFGTVFGVATAGDNDSNPDVANEASNNTFLVTWSREFSATSAEIRAQRVSTNGSLLGSTIFVSSGGVNLNPSVGDNTTSNMFLIAWQAAPSVFGPFNILCRSVDSSTGTLSASTQLLASEPGNERDPAVGGDAIKLLLTDQQEQLVVWCTGSGIRGAEVRAETGGAISVLTSFVIATDTPTAVNTHPTITKTGGVSGLYLVVWERRANILAQSDLYARVVDRNGVVIGNEAAVADTLRDEQDASVDRAPTAFNFVVAYEIEEGDGSGHNIAAVTMNVPNGILLPYANFTFIEADDDDEETDPVVCCPGAKAWIAYCDQSVSAETTIRVEAYDPAKLVQCEDIVFAQPTGIAQEPAMSWMYAAGAGGVLSLLTWGELSTTPPFSGDIQAQLLLTTQGTGTVQNLGGGCGGGGTLSSILLTPDIGTGLFQVALSGVDPTAFLALINISAVQPTVSCGLCTWVPFQVVIGQNIAGIGSASFLSTIPCDPVLIGAQLDMQYTTVLTTSTPCPLFANVSLSNILRITIGQ